MKKRGRKNLYNDSREHEEILQKEYFIDEDKEQDEDYWLDDEEDIIEDGGEEEASEEEEDYWLDEEEASEEEQEIVEESTEDELTEEAGNEVGEVDVISVESSKVDTEAERGSTVEFPVVKKKKRKKSKKGKKGRKKQKNIKNKKKFDWKKAGKGFGITVGILSGIYLAMSVFFMNHFYFNTTINGENFSGRSVKAVEEYMEDQVEGYTLMIKQMNDVEEVISGKDISLVYVEDDGIKNALKSQNAFLWPMAFFNTNATDVTVQVSYDSAKLNNKIEGLKALKIEQTEPVSAYPAFDGEQFTITPEVLGTAVDIAVLKEKVNQYITEFRPEFDMVEDNCYKLPKYTTESEELLAACDEMNKYLEASITYKMKEDVVVDKTLINKWVTVDEKLQVTFNEKAVKEWLTTFGDTYDTVGTTRSITSPWGETVQVSGGDYGWSIDEDAEYTALVKSIKAGEVIEKEPEYYQTAASHAAQDWGDTYVEVDISSQHMWMIQDGAVAMECDVVTGTPVPSRVTPTGVYAMKEKMYGKTLTGAINPATGEPEYRTPVSYWMRVTWTGIGFHDATWQYAFGGTRYQNGYGSHGCINMPYNSAATLIELVSTGMPVIIHD